MSPRTCKFDNEHAWLEKPFSCNDPSHDHFWHPENWPFDRAPAKVEYRDNGCFRASLWVLDAGGVGDRWSESTFSIVTAYGATFAQRLKESIRLGERAAAKLEAERDEYYAERRELEEVQLQGLAVPC